MYAIATNAFLSIKEDIRRKEQAHKKFIEAAIYIGWGEFIELLNGQLRQKAKILINSSEIHKNYKDSLLRYPEEILNL